MSDSKLDIQGRLIALWFSTLARERLSGASVSTLMVPHKCFVVFSGGWGEPMNEREASNLFIVEVVTYDGWTWMINGTYFGYKFQSIKHR